MSQGLIVDNFAGGGGASLGIAMACREGPHIAINHNPVALGLHAANHPATEHMVEDVWNIDPRAVTQGKPVWIGWFSPDCKHFSKAKGGKPVEKKIRGLAWVVIKWAVAVRPSIIALENVEEFEDWGPLDENNMPCPARKGRTFRLFVDRLRQLGYEVEWKRLRACDFGAPTIRQRLYLIARCDGKPIAWPAPTHGHPRSLEVSAGLLLPYRTAAECIDWSIPCPSIFLSKEEGRAIGVKRPLEEATLARIARGVKRYVMDAAEPFILNLTHGGRCEPLGAPLNTVTGAHRGEKALVAPFLTKFRSGSTGQPLTDPMCTVTANSYVKRPGGAAPIGLVAAFMAQHNGGMVGHHLTEPVSTITGKGSHQQLVSAFLTKFYGTSTGQDMREPFATVTANGKGGGHLAEVRAFLMKYYGDGGQHQKLSDPMHTIPTKDRFGLVTVAGVDYQIVDIGMRMLSARELFRAQGFPDTYAIDRTADGKTITKTDQVKLCGNSVSPVVAEAIIAANIGNQVARGPIERVAA